MKVSNLRVKIRSFYAQFEVQGENPCVKWLFWGLYTLIIIVFAWNHEPWGDEYHVWGMVRKMSAWELFLSMRVEGHFCLWHFLQWPFVKWLGMDWHSLYLISVPLMSLAAWLLLHKVRFPFLGKLLIVFSVPFFYSFPVISRCYALIPPVLMGIVVLYQQKKHPFLYCILLGLLANTHVYMEGLVAVLWCYFVYNQVWAVRKTHPQQAKRYAYAAVITLVFVLFAFVQVALGLYDMSRGKFPIGEKMNSPEQWIQTFYGVYHINVFHFLREHVLTMIPNLDLLCSLCCYVLLVVCTCKIFYSLYGVRRKQAITMLFCGLAWQIWFATNIYGMNWQRIDLIWFTLVFVLQLFYQLENRKWICVVLLCGWLLNTSSSFRVFRDLWEVYDPSTQIASEIEKDLPDDCLLYIEDWTGISDLLSVETHDLWLEIKDSCFAAEHVDCWFLLYGEMEENERFDASPYLKSSYYYDSYRYMVDFYRGSSLHLYHIVK